MIRRNPAAINGVPVIGPLAVRAPPWASRTAPCPPVAMGTRFAAVVLAARTREAYRSDWADFVRWCASAGLEPLPAEPTTVVTYVDDLATTRRVATVKRRLAAIRAAHLQASLPPPTDTPTVTAAMAQARWRQRDVVGTTTPITVAELRAMSRALPATVGGTRDRAAILVGYGAALRPSELVRLTMDDIAVGRAGLRIDTPRGAIHVPFGSARELCAVTALDEWIRRAGLRGGPVLRAVDRLERVGTAALSEKAIGRIVRRAANGAGLAPHRFTGLSLRRGMVAAAVANGTSQTTIMRQTGHRSERLVRDYIAADPDA